MTEMVKTPKKRVSTPSIQDKDLTDDIARTDNSKEDNSAEDLLRTEAESGKTQPGLRKPRIIKEAQSILNDIESKEQGLLMLRPLYTRALQEQDKQAQDHLFKLMAAFGAFPSFQKRAEYKVAGTYVGGLEKSAFERVVGDVDPTAVYAHVTAMGTVDLENDKHTLQEHSGKYINSNGDAWERGLVVNTADTFLEGALNFIEHVQVPAFAKGQPVDYLLKDVGDALYLDLLIEVLDTETAEKVVSGEYDSTSIGCTYEKVVCSKCGTVFGPNDDRCVCLELHLKQDYDYKGGQRRIAEVMREEDGGIDYNDISWVGNPAFKPAVLHDLMLPGSKEAARKVMLSELLTFGNMANIAFILPIIKAERSPFRRAFYIAATYFVLKTNMSFIKKLIVLRLIMKYPVPTVMGLAIFFRRVFTVAGVSGATNDISTVVRGVREQLK